MSHPLMNGLMSHPLMRRPRRRWILALAVVAASLALSGSAAAREAASAADATSAHQSPAQKPAKAEERHPRHHFAHHAKPRAAELDEKAPPAPARPAALHREDGALEAHPVSTVRVPPPPEELAAPTATAPAVAAEAGAAQASIGQHVDPDTARVNLLAAAERIEEAAASPAVDGASGSSPSMAIKVLALFGVCAGAAVGCYGLLTLNARRRARRQTLARPRRPVPARPLPQRDDRFAERVAQQRLFPHQFGGAIRG